MDQAIIDIFSCSPIVSEILQWHEADLASPRAVVVKFQAKDSVLLIQAMQDDDTVELSIQHQSEIDPRFSMAAELSEAMQGRAIESVVRLINMQGYIDGVELHVVRHPSAPVDRREVFRFEVGASMVHFSHGFYAGSSSS